MPGSDVVERDVAVMEATNLGVGRIYKAFLEIRRLLAGKKEIVLLVEDFALVQGVQRDLLDAITETSERGGRAGRRLDYYRAVLAAGQRGPDRVRPGRV